MKHYRSLVFRVFICLVPLSIWAQELPEVTPPSPEAASLGKFTEMPISHYTGLPNISVPLTSFEVGGKSFPVSISYHARGIQVSEVSSRIGTGWALNAGGQISRQIRHKADEQTDGYVGRYSKLMDQLNTSTNFYNNYGIRYEYNLDEQGYLTSPNGSTTDPTAGTFRFIYDRMPDQFSLSVSQLTAKFILNYEDDQPLLQKYDDVIIKYSLGGDGISSFTVTDKDGYIYRFDVSNWDQLYKNYTLQLSGDYILTDPENLDPRTNNTWLLTSIESPNGDMANLIYNEETYEHYRRGEDVRLLNNNICASCNPDLDGGQDVVSYCSHNIVHQQQLSEIRFNYDKNNLNDYDRIEFVSNDPRIDLKSGAKELDEIKVYNRNNLIKTYLLHQSYRDNVDDNNQNYYLKTFEPESGKRLFLDSISETANGVTKPPHVFTYDSQKLPNRFSNSQDLWGYYNGAQNGQFLLFMHHGITSAPIDRAVDTLKSKAGMLEKIKYPTGGSVQFSYEHNKGVKGFEFSNARFPKVNPYSKKTLSLSPIATYNSSEGVYKKETNNNDAIIENDDIVSRSLVTPFINLPVNWNSYNQNERCITQSLSNCYFSVKLARVINGVPDINNAINIYSDTTPFWVDPGKYQLIVNPPLGWNPNLDASNPADQDKWFNVVLFFDDQTVGEDTILYASGKRIKQIDFLDSVDNIVTTKYYEYKDQFDNDSGVILSIPAFGSLAQIPGIPSVGPQTPNNSVFSEDFGAVPGSPYSTYQGNTIGYSHVKEYYGSNIENHGYTSYEFLVPRDSGDYVNYPVTPPTDNEWLRGLPKFIRSYKNDNGIYKIVKEVENAYLYGDEQLSSKMFPLSLRKALNEDVTQNDIDQPLGLEYDHTRRMFRLPLISLFNNNGASYKIYHFTGGSLDTRKTIEREFDESENVTLVTQRETKFNYDDHYQPSMVTSVTSDGKPVIQTFTYPQDQASNYTVHPNTYSTDPITALAEQHRFVPLEVKTYKDENQDGYPGFAAPEELKSSSETIYAWDGSVLEPSVVKTSKGTNPLEDRIKFKNYDDEGNLLEVSRENGMNICYIYGYDSTLPVAKIENATYKQLAPYLNGIHNASDADTSSCLNSESCNENNLRTAQTSLRNGLPNAMVTTYTYDPLIGVTSMTDPKGYTVYYEYDELNRLVRVKDKDGKILSENKYHYLLD